MKCRSESIAPGAFALLAMVLMLSTPVLLITDSEAAGTSSLRVGTDDDGNLTYGMDISTGQLFVYQDVRTPLDAFDDIGYTWSGDASDQSGSDGIAWDPQTHTLKGTFATPGKRVGILAVQATDKAGNTVTSALRFTFDVTSSLDLGDSVAVSASVGDPAGKEVHSVALPGGTTYNVRTSWSGDSPFSAEYADGKVSVKTAKPLTSSDSGTYVLTVTVTDPRTADVTSKEVVVSVHEGIVFENQCLHLYAVGNGYDLPASFRFDYRLLGDVTVISSQILVSEDGPFSVADDGVAIDRASVGTPGEYWAKIVLTLSNGETAVSELRLTVLPSSEGDVSVRPISNNSNNAILTIDCKGADSVTVDWGDAIWSDSDRKADGVFNLFHPYSSQGMFLITVQRTVGGEVFTDRVMFGSGPDPLGPAGRYDRESSDTEDDGHGWGYIVLAVLAVALVLVFLFVYPVLPVLLAAVVCAVLAVAGYIF